MLLHLIVGDGLLLLLNYSSWIVLMFRDVFCHSVVGVLVNMMICIVVNIQLLYLPCICCHVHVFLEVWRSPSGWTYCLPLVIELLSVILLWIEIRQQWNIRCECVLNGSVIQVGLPLLVEIASLVLLLLIRWLVHSLELVLGPLDAGVYLVRYHVGKALDLILRLLLLLHLVHSQLRSLTSVTGCSLIVHILRWVNRRIELQFGHLVRIGACASTLWV